MVFSLRTLPAPNCPPRLVLFPIEPIETLSVCCILWQGVSLIVYPLHEETPLFCFKLGSHQLHSVVPSSYFGSDSEQLMRICSAQDWSFPLEIRFWNLKSPNLLGLTGIEAFFSDPCRLSVSLFQFLLFFRWKAKNVLQHAPFWTFHPKKIKFNCFLLLLVLLLYILFFFPISLLLAVDQE